MSRRNKSILMLGCFDTKGEEFFFLFKCLKALGESVIAMNLGVMGTSRDFPVTIEADVVAEAGGQTIHTLRETSDRGYAMEIMGKGAAKMTAKLMTEDSIKGVIAMGGGGGTYMTLLAMQDVPLGIPKVCLSTLATKDLSHQIGNKDITLMPTVVDIAGLNSISRRLMKQAAAALNGMANVQVEDEKETKGRVAISMFGNTTACVNTCSEMLRSAGYEVFTFHANGVGGRTMESLISEGYFVGVLDITTTELADELFGGICSAGPERLNAAVKLNTMQVVVPGCLDMVNFGAIDSVPERYAGREFYSWSPEVTLMRTNEEENAILGKRLMEKMITSSVPISIVLPTRGLSQLDSRGKPFYRPEINQVLFNEIRKYEKGNVKVHEVDAHINDKAFSKCLVDEFLKLLNQAGL